METRAADWNPTFPRATRGQPAALPTTTYTPRAWVEWNYPGENIVLYLQCFDSCVKFVRKVRPDVPPAASVYQLLMGGIFLL